MPRAVVGDLEDHGFADRRRAEADGPLGRLAGRNALLGGLDPVADGIAHQMENRIHHPFDEELVDLGALPGDLELHALADVAREIADDERHPAEDLADRAPAARA